MCREPKVIARSTSIYMYHNIPKKDLHTCVYIFYCMLGFDKMLTIARNTVSVLPITK